MKIIKCMCEDIEKTMDVAEENIKKAIEYKEMYPVAAKAFYNKSLALMESIKGMHDGVVTVIKNYREEKGEPPEPMLAVYNYLHERQINQAAMMRNLQDVYMKN